MAESKLYQTQIRITGLVDPKLLADLKKAGAQIKQIAGESVKVGKESKKGFEMMALGAKAASGAVKMLEADLWYIVAPIVAIASVMKGITWGKDEMAEGAEKAAKLREQMTLLKGVLEGTDLVAKHGYDINKLLGNFQASAEQLATEQGNIFGKGFYSAIETQFAEAGLGYKVSKELTGALTNFAGMKKGTLLGLTADDVKEYAEMIKRAFTTGQLGRSGKLLGLDNNAVKQFNAAYKQGNTLEMERIILSGKYFKESNAFAKEWLKGPEAELQKARTAHTAAQVKASKDWLEVQEKLETSVLKLETAFEPVLGQLGKIANDMMPDIQHGFEWVSDHVKIWARDFEGAIRTIMVVANREGFFTSFDKLKDSIGDLVKDFSTMLPKDESWDSDLRGMLHDLKEDLDEITKAINLIKAGFEFLGKINQGGNTKTSQENITGVNSTMIARNKAQVAEWHLPKGMMHASGGITTGPHLGLVGESGPELIQPLKNPDVLDQSLEAQQDFLENAKDQLDQLKIMTDILLGKTSKGTGSGNSGSGSGASAGRGVPYKSFSGSFGDNGVSHGKSLAWLPNSQGYRVGEEYDYEGRSSQYGPSGNRINTGEIGLGSELAAKYGVHQGDWVQLTKGGWRRVTETSAQPWGIEYHADYAGQFEHAGMERDTLTGAVRRNGQLLDTKSISAATGSLDDTLNKAQQALKLGTGRLDDPRIKGLASGGIVHSKILSWLGESGPEKVTPLTRGVGGRHDQSSSGSMGPIHFAPVINMHGANEDLVNQMLAVMRDNFQDALNTASFEHARRSFR